MLLQPVSGFSGPLFNARPGHVLVPGNVVVGVLQQRRQLPTASIGVILPDKLCRQLLQAVSVQGVIFVAHPLNLNQLFQILDFRLHPLHLLLGTYPLGEANILFCGRILVVDVFELATVKCDIHRGIVILSGNDIPIIPQNAPCLFQDCAIVAHSVRKLSKDFGIAIVIHNSVQCIVYSSGIPRSGRIAHATLQIIVQNQFVPGRVESLQEFPHLSPF